MDNVVFNESPVVWNKLICVWKSVLSCSLGGKAALRGNVRNIIGKIEDYIDGDKWITLVEDRLVKNKDKCAKKNY